jgi:trehalose 2-sulfotransferase
MPTDPHAGDVKQEQMRVPSRGYAICCLERTGSTLLGKALIQTDVAGKPIEYFNPAMQDKPRLRDILGDSNAVDGFNKTLNAGTTANGVFGVKIHWAHFRFLGMLIEGKWDDRERMTMFDLLYAQLPTLMTHSQALEVLRARFPGVNYHEVAYDFLRARVPDLRMIWLRRRNMVARAISHYRARQTGIWYRDAGPSNPEQAEPEHEFDLGTIHTMYRVAAIQEERWGQFFEEHGISPLCVDYDELVTDYPATMRKVLKFLDIENPPAIPQPSSAKQSDDKSLEWEQRYRALVPEESLTP